MGGQLGAQPCVSKCQWSDLVSSLAGLLVKAEQQAVEQTLFIFAWLFLNINAS